MKKLLSLIAALVIVTTAYVVTFGTPAAISSLMPQDQSAAEEASGALGQSTPSDQVGRPPSGDLPRGGSATVVVTEVLELAEFDRVLRAIGSTVASRSVNVTADVSGTIVEKSFEPNDQKSGGEVLFQLDNEAEKLNVEIAQAELDQASQALERFRSLAASSAVSAVNIADAEVAVRLAEANFGLAEVALEDRTIRAPIAGQVGLSTFDIGDRVNEGDALVTIDDLDELLIEFELPERAIGLLEGGRTIRANTPVYTGEVFEGRITAYDSRLDSVTRSVTVQALIDNSEGRLWPGMTFAVRLADRTDALPVVPATAITWTRDGAGIWVIEDQKATRMPVTILYRQGDRVWLDTDLSSGTIIVAEGAQKLREGASVRNVGNDKGPPTDDGESPAVAVELRPSGDDNATPAGADAGREDPA